MIEQLLQTQRDYFASGSTLPLSLRIEALKALARSIGQHEQALTEALQADLGKSPFEAYETEIGFVLSSIRHAIKHLPRWAKPQRVSLPLTHFGARGRILSEPYGVVLIMAPWNYPFQLAMEPLVGAIAAGNCALVRPSRSSPRTAAVIDRILCETFDSAFVRVVRGEEASHEQLLAQAYDYIFFTGSAPVGKKVMEAASRHLTPVTLELGGKSPCIVDQSADLSLAAKRIVWGKLINSGQTCVAPDYLLVHASLKQSLLQEMARWAEKFYGDALKSPEYPHIVNQRHFQRLQSLLGQGELLLGGRSDPGSLRMELTVLGSPRTDSPLMQEEIFGPIFPLITFEDSREVLDFVSRRPKPLALYLFSNDRAFQRQVCSRLSFGGGCINDTIMQLAAPSLPFGGVGNSGMGRYHGKASFDLFSHKKSLLHQTALFDLPVRYPPFGEKLRLLKRVMK
jgi:aldehyde dehydrogenase (NAD+)